MTTNILFLHLPKTAGRSFKQWLIREAGRNVYWFRSDNRLYSEKIIREAWEGKVLGPPFHAKVIGGHDASKWHAKAAQWTFWKTFTILREPAERMFSQYQHFKRKDEMPDLTFEEWAAGSNKWGLCHCLWCYYGGTRHQSNPMCWFYASKASKSVSHNPLQTAEEALRGALVYRMDAIDQCVRDMASWGNLDASTYEPFDITGSGKGISPEQRKLVAEKHPLDYLLWEEFKCDTQDF